MERPKPLYEPKDRQPKFVPADDPFMREAAKARAELAGDPVYPVGIVLVRDGAVVARAGNGFNRGPGAPHLCPRLMAKAKSGEGYDLCTLHDPEGHSEPMLMKAAKDAGIPTQGADAYMYGHWWACEPCWKALIEGGICDLYLVDDAHERFSRQNVYRETLRDYPENIRRFYGAL